jgi:hypothetical protein
MMSLTCTLSLSRSGPNAIGAQVSAFIFSALPMTRVDFRHVGEGRGPRSAPRSR